MRGVFLFGPLSLSQHREEFYAAVSGSPAADICARCLFQYATCPGAGFNPGGFGEGVDLEQSITTGGAQPDDSLRTKRPEGFVPIGPDGPRITSFPDQSDELNIPIILLSEGGYRNAKKGDLSADGTFTWLEPGPIRSNRQLKRDYEKLHDIIWPIDPETGYDQDVSHEVALADGGLGHVLNIKPRTRREHIKHHKENGDFKRWQKLRAK